MKLTPPLLGACCSLALLSSRDASALSTPSSAASSSSSSSIYHAILRRSSSLLDPVTGDRPTSPISPPPSSSSSSATAKKKSLIVILPQLGEFDSSEYVGYLASVLPYLEDAGIDLRCVGIGEPGAGRLFCDFTGLPISRLLVDPGGVIHRELGLYAGPGFEVSESVSDDILKFLLGSLPGGVPAGDGGQIRPVATAWLNCEYSGRHTLMRRICKIHRVFPIRDCAPNLPVVSAILLVPVRLRHHYHRRSHILYY